MKVETFPAGSSVCTELSPDGTFTFSFGKDGSIPEAANVVVQNKLLAEEVLTVNIGYGGNCHVPKLRKSVVSSLAELIKKQIHVSGVEVESASFPPSVKPPGTTKTLFLAGAGVRDGYREGKYMKFSAVSLYLEDDAVPWLAAKWKGKNAEELEKSDEFVNDLITGPFEKLVYVKALETIFGERWSRLQSEICRELWKSLGVYTEAENEALNKFYGAMKVETFVSGYSIFQTLSTNGTLTLSFSKDGSVPESWNTVIENKLLTENIVDVNIGKNGVTPATRKNIVARLAELINKHV
jgi:chalcone isomerase